MTDNFPKAEIMSQGEEVMSGAVVDTNAAWLAQELIGLGFDVTRHTAVGDRLDALVELLREIAARADCCVCTGGLGPTVDDLTATAVADAFGRPLVLDEKALEAIRAWYDRRDTPMPETNRKQALLPASSLRLNNQWGTAPGFALEHGRCRFYFLPGVPWEMRGIFEQTVRPQLSARFHTRPPRGIVLRTVGVGESVLQARINRLALPSEANLGFCVVGPEVQVKLHLPADFEEARARTLVAEIRAVLGEEVFGVEGLGEAGGDLAVVVGRLLDRRSASLAIAETVSAGVLAALCAPLDCLRECRVYPGKQALCQAFGLDALASAETLVGEAAQSLRRATGADYALVQLDSGGAVVVALATPETLLHGSRPLGHEPNRRRLIATAYTLDLLRRHLLAYPEEL